MTKRWLFTYMIAICAFMLSPAALYAQNGQQPDQPDQLNQPIVSDPENQLFYEIGNDHRDLAILLSRTGVTAEQDGESVLETFDELARQFLAHGAAKAETFYQTINNGADNVSADNVSNGLGMVFAQADHAAKLLLWELYNIEPTSPNWLPKFKVFEEHVANHIKIESTMGFTEAMLAETGNGDTQAGEQYTAAKEQSLAEIETLGLQTYLEQDICQPIMDQEQEFCILESTSGTSTGQSGQSGQSGQAQ